MNSKIIAIAVVVIVAVAGAGVFLMLGNNDAPATEDETRLTIYGNANLDDSIDNDDVAYIEAVINGSGKKTAYCDANQDGKVDSEDVEIVKKFISKTPCKMYYDDIKTGVASVDFPIDSFLGIHQNVLIPLCAIGAQKYMHGYVLSEAGVTGATMLSGLFSSEKNVNTSYNLVDFEKFSNLSVKPKYIITYNTSLSNESKILRSGTEVIHLPFSKIDDMSSATLTAGYMLGLESGAKEYVGFVDELIKTVQKKLDDNNVTRRTVMCAYMTDCIDNKDGIHSTAAIAAGGDPVTDWTGAYREFSKGDEWLYEYNPEFLFYCTAWGYTDTTLNLHDKYLDWGDYYNNLSVYKAGKFYVVNSIMPPHLISAYMAQLMYPDVFGEHFADELNNDFVQKFFPGFYAENSYDAANYNYFITPTLAGVTP
ncbi:MAG: dockerin type I domain-containing protein [archaeon]|nr:dockerin type I domain-containing protein [archaeon]